MTPKLRIRGLGTLTEYAFSATGPVTPLQDTETNDNAKDHEARGEILNGTDTYEYSGVPTGFEAEHPWELDIDIDVGNGWKDWRPTYLNAATVEIRAIDRENATYLFRFPGDGMVIRAGQNEENDVIVDIENTFGTGHSIKGNTDSYEFWPPFGLEMISDHPCEWRIPDAKDPNLREWTKLTAYIPEMSV